MKNRLFLIGILLLGMGTFSALADPALKLSTLTPKKGIAVVMGLAEAGQADAFLKTLVSGNEFLIFFQSESADDVQAVKLAAEKLGLLGTRIFAAGGSGDRIALAGNLAGVVLVEKSMAGKVPEAEMLRVLHPEGVALAGGKKIVKPFPEGLDFWRYPNHGPDNNPSSSDALAIAPFRTQFIAAPKWAPFPVVSVMAGGRTFKALGHIAQRDAQNKWLNTLLGINAYNGRILWTRPLPEGFNIHRNTLIATTDVLYFGDNTSCKLLDARTGEVKKELVVPDDVSAGKVWKWMAMQDDLLFALVGGQEDPAGLYPSDKEGYGHWGWAYDPKKKDFGMAGPVPLPGFDYSKLQKNPQFGNTLLAVNVKTGKVLWHHRETDSIDGRATVFQDGKIFYYCPDKSLSALDVKTGQPLWKTQDSELLKAIGPYAPDSNNPGKGHSFISQSYLYSREKFLLFAGSSMRSGANLVCVSTEDGKLLWQASDKRLFMCQLILRGDGVWAFKNDTVKFDYQTGKKIGKLAYRKASCTRPTANLDSFFFRQNGTASVNIQSGQMRYLESMRPGCMDGVIPSNGMIYWSPWMCSCALSFYGHIGLAPAEEVTPAPAEQRLVAGEAAESEIAANPSNPGDCPAYRGDSARSCQADIAITTKPTQKWEYKNGCRTTAPVTANDVVYLGDTSGRITALSAATGEVNWRFYTDGPVNFPPEIVNGRAYAGSADGWVYALQAATGKLIWKFQAAPLARRINVNGTLISSWPVAGGVVCKDGGVYAAAGLAHYDDIHVYALDATTGKPIWHNGTSGNLESKKQSGVSLLGSLAIRDGELQFHGGNLYSPARYDLKTGKCLNQTNEPGRFHRSMFPAYYPKYGRQASLKHQYADGGKLLCTGDMSGREMWGVNAYSYLFYWKSIPTEPAVVARPEPSRNWFKDNKTYAQYLIAIKKKATWKSELGRRFRGFVLLDGAILTAGQIDSNHRTLKPGPFMKLFKLADGSTLWEQTLPASLIKDGVVVDSAKRIFAALETGTILCYKTEQ